MLWFLYIVQLERRHIWLRWTNKYKDMQRETVENVARDWRWEDLDEEFKLLLRNVDAELAHKDHLAMNQEEIGIAIQTLLQYRDEGNPKYAIYQAVRNVQIHRKQQLSNVTHPTAAALRDAF
eukprot:jgi/Chrzof1/10161/Cz04g31070.t1